MSDLQCSQGPFCQCPFLASFEKISGVQLPKLTQSLAPRNRQVADGKFARHSTPTRLSPWLDLTWLGDDGTDLWPQKACSTRAWLQGQVWWTPASWLGDHQDGAPPQPASQSRRIMDQRHTTSGSLLSLPGLKKHHSLFLLRPTHSCLCFLPSCKIRSLSPSTWVPWQAKAYSTRRQVREATSEWSTLWLSTELNCPIVFCCRCFLSDLRFRCRY